MRKKEEKEGREEDKDKEKEITKKKKKRKNTNKKEYKKDQRRHKEQAKDKRTRQRQLCHRRTPPPLTLGPGRHGGGDVRRRAMAEERGCTQREQGRTGRVVARHAGPPTHGSAACSE